MKKIVLKIGLLICILFFISILQQKNNIFGWDCTRGGVDSIQDQYNDDRALHYSHHGVYGHENIIYKGYSYALDATGKRDTICWDVDGSGCAAEWLVPAIISEATAITLLVLNLTGVCGSACIVGAIVFQCFASYCWERITRLESLMMEQQTVDNKLYPGNLKMHHWDLSGVNSGWIEYKHTYDGLGNIISTETIDHPSLISTMPTSYYDPVSEKILSSSDIDNIKIHFYVFQKIYNFSTWTGKQISENYFSPVVRGPTSGCLSVGLHMLGDFYGHKPAYSKMMNDDRLKDRREEFRVGLQEIMRRVMSRANDSDPYYQVWIDMDKLLFADKYWYPAADGGGPDHHIIYDAAIDATKDFFMRIFNGGLGASWY